MTPRCPRLRCFQRDLPFCCQIQRSAGPENDPALLFHVLYGSLWRRGWDSNPRSSSLGCFQDSCLQPLGHLSIVDRHDPGMWVAREQAILPSGCTGFDVRQMAATRSSWSSCATIARRGFPCPRGRTDVESDRADPHRAAVRAARIPRPTSPVSGRRRGAGLRRDRRVA